MLRFHPAEVLEGAASVNILYLKLLCDNSILQIITSIDRELAVFAEICWSCIFMQSAYQH
jgi:hypothetical protein